MVCKRRAAKGCAWYTFIMAPATDRQGHTHAHTHDLSINIYCRGDASLGDGPPHIAIALYEIGSTICTVHHIRVPDEENYIYDPRGLDSTA
ncbi:hypothetical protein BDV19DRAFT_386516 [Aspergillus venezuelensis]